MKPAVSRIVLAAALFFLCSAAAQGSVVYQQPPLSTGGLLQSSWWDPNDSDYDVYSWDDFVLSAAHPITEISWRGGFMYGGGYGGPVVNFTVEIYPSIAAGSQPDVTAAPLVSYETGGNAGQTYAGVFGGTTMYDYRFTLPSPFQAAAGVRYWVYIVAWQHGIPEWGFCNASGGNGRYFRFVRGLHMYQAPPGDFAMTLYSSDAQTYTINASASPAGSGTVQGAGAYPVNSTASLAANSNPGWGFFNWTENNAQVSSSPDYAFAASANRSLTANFAIDPQGRVFDFDDAPVHTSLPIDLTHGGLTAHFSASYYGLSIQPADTLGFTPAGFAGLCVYPNTVFATDLIVDFSQPLTSFSILYSPQELGCDNSATMRATGYLNGVFAATATATAPVPGTWPTGTLRLESAAPFDRVVVHYDARPPTCQDWGPIFLADNMVVVMAAAPCPGDLNGDRIVDLSDLTTLLAHFGTPSGATLADGDLNGDGMVDLSDLASLLSSFGTIC